MRKEYIDLLKILSAYCVVLLHSTAYALYDVNGVCFKQFVFLNSLTRFAVPLFFMCSGAVILRSDLNINRLFKRFSRILLPLIFWSVFYELYLIYCGIPKDILVILSDILHDRVMYHMWFLYSLLGIYLLIPFLHKMVTIMSSEDWKWFWLLSLIVISAKTIYAYFDSYFPVSFITVPTFIIYVCAGYYLSNFKVIRMRGIFKMGGYCFALCLPLYLLLTPAKRRENILKNL